MADILDTLNKNEVQECSDDLREVMRVNAGIQRKIGKLADFDIKKFQSLIELFNRKYPGIMLKIDKKITGMYLRLFLNEASVKDMFIEVAAKLSGLKSVGTKGFDEVTVEEGDKLSKKAGNIKDEAYASYYYLLGNIDSFLLKFNKAQNMVEMMYNLDIIQDEASAECKLCAYYGAKSGFDNNINIIEEAASFGFVSMQTTEESRKFLRHFEPKIGE